MAERNHFRGRALLAPLAIVTIWVAMRASMVGDVSEQSPTIMTEILAAPDKDRNNLQGRNDDVAIGKAGLRADAAKSIGNVYPRDAYLRSGQQQVSFGVQEYLSVRDKRMSAKSPPLGNFRDRTRADIWSDKALPVAPTAKAPFVAVTPALKSDSPRPPSPGIDPKTVTAERNSPAAPKGKRLSLYSYAFWRASSDDTSLTLGPAAQYGGSQIGVNALYALGEKKTSPALLARFSIDADSFDQPEFALGGRWQPIASVPISISAERRFRGRATDSFAIYAAGGFDGKRLPLKISVSGYAQVGANLADDALAGESRLQHFYDANLRADRPVATLGKSKSATVKLRAGAGAWAGGQTGINRFDVGPSASVDFGLVKTNFRLSADYRFRVAGDAQPGSGPAVTLTASY